MSERLLKFAKESGAKEGESWCKGHYCFTADQLTKFAELNSEWAQYAGFNLDHTCARIKRLCSTLGIEVPTQDNEMLMGCLFSLLGTACGIIEHEKQLIAKIAADREELNKIYTVWMSRNKGGEDIYRERNVPGQIVTDEVWSEMQIEQLNKRIKNEIVQSQIKKSKKSKKSRKD